MKIQQLQQKEKKSLTDIVKSVPKLALAVGLATYLTITSSCAMTRESRVQDDLQQQRPYPVDSRGAEGPRQNEPAPEYNNPEATVAYDAE